jgi:hypothetical protein
MAETALGRLVTAARTSPPMIDLGNAEVAAQCGRPPLHGHAGYDDDDQRTDGHPSISGRPSSQVDRLFEFALDGFRKLLETE